MIALFARSRGFFWFSIILSILGVLVAYGCLIGTLTTLKDKAHGKELFIPTVIVAAIALIFILLRLIMMVARIRMGGGARMAIMIVGGILIIGTHALLAVIYFRLMNPPGKQA